MSNGYQDLVTCLENRYDYHSARVVASDALLSTGIAEADTYKPAEMQKLVDALATGARHMDKVWLALGLAPTGSAMPQAPVVEAAEEAAPPSEESEEGEKAPAKKGAKKASAKKAKAKK